jgi:hypothetical protein
MPPPADNDEFSRRQADVDIAALRVRLESLDRAVQDYHQENRGAHAGILSRLDVIERKPLIIFGDSFLTDLRGICRSIAVAMALGIGGWLLYLWKENPWR